MKRVVCDTNIYISARVRELSTIVEPEVRVSIIQEKQDDNRILECAIQARAHYLVTGDTKHILPLREYQGISICSPADFLQRKLWLEDS